MMLNGTVNLSLVFYSLALVTGAIYVATRQVKSNRFFLILLGAGLISNILAVLIRWSVTGHSPMSNMYETLVCLSAIFVMIYLYLARKQSSPVIGFLVTLLAIIIISVTKLFNASAQPLVPALKSNWLTIHVLLCLTGYAALTISFVSSLIILLIDNKSRRDETAGLPFMVTYEMVRFGFFFLTLGIITGAVWAEQTWGRYWSWDPKESWALITWFIFAVYLHGKRLLNWSPQRLAWIAVAGFGAMLFTYFGVNYILPGLHAYAQ